MLIDACKLLMAECHVDGFRYDATHSFYMDHAFLNRLADELKAFKPNVFLVAENLPNEVSLNRQGFDGYAQWSNEFHDKIKALLREGEFEGKHYDTDDLGEIFYFSKNTFASHTNNVVNYCESHDENSVPHESNFSPNLNTPAAKERKGRLGLFATMVALGQPMIYMGQEFNVERPRNKVSVTWPENLDEHGFFQWASRLMRLRKRYPGLRLQGYNPIEEGEFSWLIAPWLAPECGGGRIVVGWRATPHSSPNETIVVLLNFENTDIPVTVHFGRPGVWVRLASIDEVNDLPPDGSNSAEDATAIRTEDGSVEGFVLPDSSGFIYKWEAP
jgi:1,4-alpha-glucan branching enzyme